MLLATHPSFNVIMEDVFPPLGSVILKMIVVMGLMRETFAVSHLKSEIPEFDYILIFFNNLSR